MQISDFERLLAVALPARGRLAITLTDFPDDDDLPDLLDRAIVAGEACGAPLVEIHAPRSRYQLDAAWRHAQITESGDVLRLVFEGEAAPAALGPSSAAREDLKSRRQDDVTSTADVAC